MQEGEKLKKLSIMTLIFLAQFTVFNLFFLALTPFPYVIPLALWFSCILAFVTIYVIYGEELEKKE